MNRQEKLKKLHDIVLAIYVGRKDSHPEVAAQYHVERFVAQNKNDQKWFDDLLQMEIEDCSRAIATL